MSRIITAPTGPEISCKGWQQEAAMRMLMNNLDPNNAELPDQLIVYGGNGKAARNWECYDAIVASLRDLEGDETLMVQSGKPVGIFKTHADAPRVLIANANLVGEWATWDYFRKLDKMGLIMFGQMTAGSWIYIGSQGIVQGTYETFAEAGNRYFNGSLEGRLVVSAGLGGMGGAQPLAATLNDGVFIGMEVDEYRIKRRLDTGYVDKSVNTLDEAMSLATEAMKNKEPLSIAIHANAADILPEMVKRDIVPDILTDQTSAHDELNGYVPHGMSFEDALKLRESDPDDYIKRSMDSMGVHVQAMLDLQKMGAITFDYGNNIRAQAEKNGVKNAFDIPGFVPEYIRPLFCEGKGPFRWAALSGDPEDIYATDEAVLKEFPEDKALHRWIKKAREKVHFQGLPCRICWLGYGERDRMGVIFNRMVAEGKLKAPVVIGRDHLDGGSVASPYRETEGMKDGSDAIADWPILNAMLNAVSGATWVSFHHGGGVGIGYALHAGFVVVCDGTDAAEDRVRRVLTNDPGTAVMRHVDAGYDIAKDVARDRGVKIPMMK